MRLHSLETSAHRDFTLLLQWLSEKQEPQGEHTEHVFPPGKSSECNHQSG